MLAEVVVESSRPACSVSREGLGDVIGALTSADPCTSRWNLVDVLELLLEAGQYKVAGTLVDGAILSMNGAPLARLFVAYRAYISYITSGKISESLKTLEQLRTEIAEGAHSAQDRIRVAVLQARVLTSLAVSSTEGEFYAARAEAIYNDAYRCARMSGLNEVAAAVTVELVKLYACTPVPESRKAQAALSRLVAEVDRETLPPTLAFDIKRVTFLCQSENDDEVGELPVIKCDELESEAARLGPIAEGLVALSLSRKNSDGDSLKVAEKFFRGTPFLAGSFESAYQSGMEAARRGLHIKARQLFTEAKGIAESAGFLHGKLIAVHAFVTCALRDGDGDGSQRYGEPLKRLLSSEVAKVVIGLPMATHALSRGEPETALSVVSMCRVTYRKLKMVREEREALFMHGTILSMMGDWEAARVSIVRSCRNVDKALSVDVVAHRKAALAQTILMAELGRNSKAISTATLGDVRILLEGAAQDVRVSQPAEQRGTSLARVLLSLAQIASLEKRSMDALSALAEAREIFQRGEMRVDVAVVDALAGVALLDVARHRGAYAGTQLFDESVAAFDRAFEVFQQTPYLDARWKLAYYLALACHMNAHFKRSPSDQQRWREMAIAWLRSAEEDYAITKETAREESTLLYEGYQFAVGLSPDVLEELKEALGLKRRTRKGSLLKERKKGKRGKRRLELLH